MNKIDKIKKILHEMKGYFRNGEYYTKEITKNVFKIRGGFFYLPLTKEEENTEYSEITIDFDNQTLSLYCYNISYHNGDYYNDYSRKLDWSFVENSYNEFLKLYEIFLKKEAEEILRRENVKNLIDSKLKELED